MAKPYSFQAVIPTEEMIDLGTRLVHGKRGLAELKDATGIAGCILEKYDGDELVAASFAHPLMDSLEGPGQSLEDIGRALQSFGEGAAAVDIAILLPIILQAIRLIIEFIQKRRGGNEGDDNGGPV